MYPVLFRLKLNRQPFFMLLFILKKIHGLNLLSPLFQEMFSVWQCFQSGTILSLDFHYHFTVSRTNTA